MVGKKKNTDTSEENRSSVLHLRRCSVTVTKLEQPDLWRVKAIKGRSLS